MENNLVKKNYRYRLYPNEQQKKDLDKLFGCCRYVYNRLIKENEKNYKSFTRGELKERPSCSSYSLEKIFTTWRNEEKTKWLSEPSSQAIRQVTKQLAKAFSNFFAGKTEYPSLKKRNTRQSAQYSNKSFSLKDNKVKLNKIKGYIPFKVDRKLPLEKYNQCRILKESTGNYYIFFTVEIPKSVTTGKNFLGIDAGITSLFTFSDGTKIPNPKNFFKQEKRIIFLTNCLRNKKRYSIRRKKLRRKIANINLKLRCQRYDMLHKLTTFIIRNNQAVCIEHLLIKQLIKSNSLVKHILDASWGMFRHLLINKVKQNKGCKLYLADPYFPSTQLCSCCGRKPMSRIKLGTTSWTCVHCGEQHDRDINAAKNLEALAKKNHVVFKKEESNIVLIDHY